MSRLENPDILYALLGIPILLGLFYWMHWKRKKTMLKIGDIELVKQLVPARELWRVRLKSALFILAYALLIVGLANPQVGSRMQDVKAKGAEIMIALDVSNSMLAEDIKPNRLKKAKLEIGQLINQLKSDRLGLIIFAGRAYTQLPLTTDYAASKMFLKSVRPGIVPTQGTAIGEALSLGISSFSKDQSKNKAIILITDGENHEDDAVTLAEEAADQGIVVNVIGMGDQNGVPIPIYRGGGKKDFRKDQEGNVVVTKLNENLLQQITAKGKGVYVRAGKSSTGLKQLYSKLKELEKTEFGSRQFADYDDFFQYFLLAAILLLLVDLLILPVKRVKN